MSSEKIVVTILSVFFFMTAEAQVVKSLSDDPAKFPGELEVVLSSVTSPTAGMQIREVLEPFLEYWNAGLYDEKEKTAIIRQSNMILGKRMPAYPNLYHYVSIAYYLKKDGNKEALKYWSVDFDIRIPDATQRRTESYLEQYNTLASRKILYESPSFAWFTSDTSLLIEYDTAVRVMYRDIMLSCATKKDTSRILGTSGMFYPATLEWTGKNGRVTWEKVGLSADSVYADLADYRINMKRYEYRADSARFVNKKYFERPLLGVFSDEALTSMPGSSSTHPMFETYTNTLEIKNLYRNVDYLGGFSMKGTRVTGAGSGNQNAALYIKRGDKVIASIKAGGFRFQKNQVTANPASIMIPIKDDSIFHAGLQFKYFADSSKLILFQEEDAISRGRYFNSYHNIDMDCGAMYWYIDSNYIDFSTLQIVNDINRNSFYSSNFFSPQEFYRLQGIDDKNPLYIISDFANAYGTNEVTPDILSHYMNRPPEQVKAMMLRLGEQGFLAYDLVNDRAVIMPKLNHYIDSKAGKKDYDVISINSTITSTHNARLDLKSYDLLVRGVDKVFLSNSQNVLIFPVNKEIVIKEGLDFVFTGNIHAGKFDFYAHDCSFEYDSFKLNIPYIDSLSFSVTSFERDEFGKGPDIKVNSVIEDLSGKIKIDSPNNKSGLKKYPVYPIFTSEKESFVYYDYKDPAYDRDRFAYTLDHFELDSLDDFNTDNLIFTGYLASAGIFPDIPQPLKVQPDYSLGFINKTPAEGYPAYGESGVFTNTVNLNGQGLRGLGSLSYLTSLTYAKDFHFYPDSMITELAETFTIDTLISRVEYPKVSATELYQAWYPYSDTMHLQTIKAPFRMYNEKAEMYGDLFYSSTGLTGKGNVNFESVELASQKYLFKHHTIDADTLDFKLFTKGTDNLAVAAQQYRTHVDFEERTVEFRTNQKGSFVSFPYNNFVCYMDNIDWFMDKSEMKLYNDLGTKYAGIDEMSRKELLKLDLTGSDLVATSPEADSLSFFSVTARYDLINYIIDAENVKLIRVADAAIFPDSSYVKISRGGKIQTLLNAGIIADTTNQYHTIEKAQIDIISRNSFKGKGSYQYHDSSSVASEIPLSTISVDTALHTIATGAVAENLNFFLNPHFGFKGNMNMNSGRKELYFDGGFKTTDECYSNAIKYWVYFKSWVDPDQVRIPVQKPHKDVEGRKLNLALQISESEEDIYSLWFAPKKFPKDTSLVEPEGELYFDENETSYRIDQPDDKKAPGFNYDTRTCSFKTSGPLTLGLNYEYIDVITYGDISYMIVPDSTVANLTMALDFLFYEGCLMVMADSLDRSNLKGLDVTRKDYQGFLDYVMGDESENFKEQLASFGRSRRLPDILGKSIILTDVNLYWNSFTNSYISRGPIGVMNLGKDPVNRYVSGYIELLRRRSGDGLTIYLETAENKYYYFDYKNGIMQVLSYDKEFNNRLNEVKPEKRELIKPGAEYKYEYIIADKHKMTEFIRKMQSLSY
jgi:hypothetical protein